MTWLPSRWLNEDERGPRAGERPPTGVLNGWWYCDPCRLMGDDDNLAEHMREAHA